MIRRGAWVLLAAALLAPPCLAQLGPSDRDKDGDGVTKQQGDCNDNDPSIRPGAPELCNGKDDDCDGERDEGNVCPDRCPDEDGDGWAVCGGCEPGGGDRCGDCDDGASSVNPDRPETCNGRDDDCDGAADEGNPSGGSCSTGLPGICGPGTFVCAGGQATCEPIRDPRAEICGNGEDDDCDGQGDGADLECAPGCQGGLGQDTDVDGVPDCADNCPGMANAGQADFDADRQGDACETGARLADLDGSGRVDGGDLVRLARAFGRACGQGGYERPVDLDRDCAVDGTDLALLAPYFGLPR